MRAQITAGSAWMSCTASAWPAASEPDAVWACFVTGLPVASVASSDAVSVGIGGAPVYAGRTPWCGCGLVASAASAGASRLASKRNIRRAYPGIVEPGRTMPRDPRHDDHFAVNHAWWDAVVPIHEASGGYDRA